MVKLQKPIPKKLKEKTKLGNPIKKQKDELRKDKTKSSTKNVSKKLLDVEISMKKKLVTKPAKSEVQKSIKVKKSSKEKEILHIKQSNEPKTSKFETNGSTKETASTSKLIKQNTSAKPLKESLNGKQRQKESNIATNASDEQKISDKLGKAKKKNLAPKSSFSLELLNAKTVIPKKIASATKERRAKENKKKNAKTPLCVEEPQVKKTVQPTPKAKLEEGNPKDSKKKIKKEVALSGETSHTQKPAKALTKLNAKKGAKTEKGAKPQTTNENGEEETVKYRKNKIEGEENGEKKVKTPRTIFRYKPFPYDEERFDSIVTKENIAQVAEALKKLVQKEIAAKKKGIFDDFRYMLQVGCFKIPSCPKRMVKLFLRHPMVEKGDDVLFIVPDLQRGGKVDYEPTKQHYEDLLRPIGLDWLTVMPMNQLRKEYVTFDQKKRLVASYDHFICDGRIVSHVVGMLGKLAQKPRVTLHAVRRTAPENLKIDIEKALSKTAYRQLCKSTLYTIPLATHRFTSDQVADNVIKVVRKLKHIFPGGMGNVRNLYLKIDIIGTSALPLYVSMAQPPEETPYVVGPREKHMLQMKKEANEVLSKFAMTKEGKLVKLNKAVIEKKRKLKEMQTALKEGVDGQPKPKKAKKGLEVQNAEQDAKAKVARKDGEEEEPQPTKNAKKAIPEAKKKQKKEEAKELELPENEEDDEDTSEDEDDDQEVQLAGSSDEEESEEMGQFDQEDDDDLEAESDIEIFENGLADEDDEESGDEQQEEANTSDGDNDEEEGDDDDDGDDDEDEDDDDDDESD